MRALLLVLLLAGCYQYEDTKPAKGTFYDNARVLVYTLEDGTRCAVHVSGGVHCDWGCKP